MADSSDVEAALVGEVGAILTAAGGALATTRVYRGWPQSALLDPDLAAGTNHVSVVAIGVGKGSVRYLGSRVVRIPQAATLTVTMIPGQAVFAGAGGAGQVAGVVVDGVATAYRLHAADTPASVAAALANLLPGAVADGSALTVAGLTRATIGVDQPAMQEVRRERRQFQIASWCASPAVRDAIAALIVPAMAEIGFLALPDGTLGRAIDLEERIEDRAEADALWRRDLLIEIEYPVVLRQSLPQMLFGTSNATLDGGVVLQSGDAVLPDTAFEDGSGDVLTDPAGHVLGEFQ